MAGEAGRCVIEMMDRGLVDFVISTSANLHYAMNFTLRGSPFANDVELCEDGVIRIYDVLFPARPARNRRLHPRLHPRSGLNEPVATSNSTTGWGAISSNAIRVAKSTRSWAAVRRTLPRRPATARSG
jgi:hypothetical protein